MRVFPLILLALLATSCSGPAVRPPRSGTTAGSGSVMGAIGGNRPLGTTVANRGAGQLNLILFSPERRRYDRARGGDAHALQRGRPSPSGRI